MDSIDQPFSLLSAVAALIAALAAVGAFVHTYLRNQSKQDREVEPRRLPSLEAHFATKAEIRHTDAMVESMRRSMDERFAATSRASAEGREKIYHRLSALEQSASRQQADAEHHGIILAKIERKLDVLVEGSATLRADMAHLKEAGCPRLDVDPAARGHRPSCPSNPEQEAQP